MMKAYKSDPLSMTAKKWVQAFKVGSRSFSGKKEMENGCGGGVETQWWWWWAMASMAKFGWGISAYKRGFAGDSRLMPLKAFAVASLFVGSAASASIASLQASGIHKVQDLIELGANIRTGLGVPPRVANE